MGDYQTVDKTKEREKIRDFLEKKEFVDIGVTERKAKPNLNVKGLEFDKNGKRIRV